MVGMQRPVTLLQMRHLYDRLGGGRPDPFPAVPSLVPRGLRRRLADAFVHVSVMHGAGGQRATLILHHTQRERPGRLKFQSRQRRTHAAASTLVALVQSIVPLRYNHGMDALSPLFSLSAMQTRADGRDFLCDADSLDLFLRLIGVPG
jgi:hypothetical protein